MFWILIRAFIAFLFISIQKIVCIVYSAFMISLTLSWLNFLFIFVCCIFFLAFFIFYQTRSYIHRYAMVILKSILWCRYDYVHIQDSSPCSCFVFLPIHQYQFDAIEIVYRWGAVVPFIDLHSFILVNFSNNWIISLMSLASCYSWQSYQTICGAHS